MNMIHTSPVSGGDEDYNSHDATLCHGIIKLCLYIEYAPLAAKITYCDFKLHIQVYWTWIYNLQISFFNYYCFVAIEVGTEFLLGGQSFSIWSWFIDKAIVNLDRRRS